ncbi:DUF1302 domain-containing protein [Duganella sp. FT3S]|uniref:DUF1302 domain-containing protein n=1 Tax=Rugamonas fusca TaxID=2758568 RepID=A0A7W2ED89_9BURK|nr:DUF1302 domain-containing protein [Rugamonas fusca]MBA5603796.1 DUF1302 domain-containing protein [Rugamonas fusca]
MHKQQQNRAGATRPTALAMACRMALATMALAAAHGARADSFTLDNGVEGRWSLNASMGASWRAANRDPALVSAANGGTAGVGNGHDDGNLNFNKGTAYASGPKATGELQLKRDNLGLFVRANAWYDYTLSDKGVAHGSFNNGYVPGARLSDQGFYANTGFSGAALADAYVSGEFDVAGKPLNVKLGKQVVNWGESAFIPGINAMGAFDLTAAHRPGAQVKEILRPLPQLTANLGLGDGVSVEAFYQLKWEHTLFDGCGTYWSLVDSLNCSGGAVVFGDALGNDQKQYNGVPVLAALPPALLNAVGAGALATVPFNFRLGRAPDATPKNSGQFGLSSHVFVDALSTDFGFYFANYHARTPVLSAVHAPSPAPSLYSGQYAAQLTALSKVLGGLGQAAAAKQIGMLGAIPGTELTWDYDATNIQSLAVSAATELGGVSVFGEASHTQGVPVQINAPDLVVGSVLGLGPQAALARWVRDPSVAQGSVSHGYDLKNKDQIQVSALKLFGPVLGASSASVLGEVGFQHWSGIGDPATSTRYGRGFLYGFGPTAALGGTCAGLNGYAPYCENQGYVTTSAWGYRLQGELTFSDVYAGINLKPKLFWSHDVKGYSGDGTFVQDRQTLGTTLRADYNNRYYAELSYTRYNKNAKYDVLHDRDNYSFVVGVNF